MSHSSEPLEVKAIKEYFWIILAGGRLLLGLLQLLMEVLAVRVCMRDTEVAMVIPGHVFWQRSAKLSETKHSVGTLCS